MARPAQVVLLCPGSAQEPFWQDAVACAKVCAQQLGHTLSVLYADRDHLQMIRFGELLAQASPAPDLVLVPNEKLSALGVIRALAKGRVPSLLFHNRLTPEQSRQLAQDPGLQRHCLGSTCIDQFEAGRITAQHLIDRGRLPAQAQWWLMSGDRSTPASVDRIEGVHQAWRAAGYQPSRENLLFGQWRLDAARDETAKLLARQGMPHALWCGSDLMTEGCLQALARQDGGASAAHRPVVSSVNHVPALLKLIHDGQVSCTAAGHFVSAAWALGLWEQHRSERIHLHAQVQWRGRAFVLVHAGNVAEAAQRLRPAALAGLDFRRLPLPDACGEADLRPLLRWSAKA